MRGEKMLYSPYTIYLGFLLQFFFVLSSNSLYHLPAYYENIKLPQWPPPKADFLEYTYAYNFEF